MRLLFCTLKFLLTFNKIKYERVSVFRSCLVICLMKRSLMAYNHNMQLHTFNKKRQLLIQIFLLIPEVEYQYQFYTMDLMQSV